MSRSVQSHLLLIGLIGVGALLYMGIGWYNSLDHGIFELITAQPYLLGGVIVSAHVLTVIAIGAAGYWVKQRRGRR